MSEKPSIYEVFAAVKREVGPVGKDSRNQQQNFNYRGIDAVVNAVAGALDKHGVITIPMLQDLEYGTVEVGQKRSLMAHVRLKVTYRFAGPAGDHFDATVPGEAMDSGDKATPKAMSVAYRIALLQTLNLPTGDADPDSQTYERSPRAASAGSAFDDAVSVPPRQGGDDGNRQRPAQPLRPADTQQPQVVTDTTWLAGALHVAPVLTTLAACRFLWTAAAGKASKADAARVQGLLRPRMEALRQAGGGDGALDPADPWALKLEETSTPGDAAPILDELAAMLGAGRIDQAHAGRVEAMLLAKFPETAIEGKAAA